MLTDHTFAYTNVLSNVFIEVFHKNRGLDSFNSSQGITSWLRELHQL